MQIYSKSQIKSQTNASSFLNRFWFSLLYLVEAKLDTLNFYTEFWDFAPLINYGNLCKFIPKITKIASSPSFLDRFSFCLFCLIGLGEGFKTCTQNFENSLIMLIYANLRRPRKGPGGAIGFSFLFISFLIIIIFFFFFFFFFFFMSLPGRQIYIFLTLIFLFLVPSRGIKCLFFDQ